MFNDHSVVRDNAHVYFIARNLDNVGFVKANSLQAITEAMTLKLYIDNCIDEPKIATCNQNKDFNKNNITNIISLTIKSETTDDNHNITKAFVDSLSEKERNRLDLCLVMNNHITEFKNTKLTIVDSITVNRDSATDNELSNFKKVLESIKRSQLLLLSLTDREILKQTGFTDQETNTKKIML